MEPPRPASTSPTARTSKATAAAAERPPAPPQTDGVADGSAGGIPFPSAGGSLRHATKHYRHRPAPTRHTNGPRRSREPERHPGTGIASADDNATTPSAPSTTKPPAGTHTHRTPYDDQGHDGRQEHDDPHRCKQLTGDPGGSRVSNCPTLGSAGRARPPRAPPERDERPAWAPTATAAPRTTSTRARPATSIQLCRDLCVFVVSFVTIFCGSQSR